MSSNPPGKARKPLGDVQNTAGAGMKRTGPAVSANEPAAKRKTAIPVPSRGGRRGTMLGRLAGPSDTASAASDRTQSQGRRGTVAGTRSGTSSFRSIEPSRAGRRRANMTFTETSTASKPKTLSGRPPPPKKAEPDPETIARITSQEARSNALESQLQALTQAVASGSNKAASEELTELKARLTATEEKLQAAEKEVNEQKDLLRKAEMEVQIKDLKVENKASEMQRNIDDERKKAESVESELIGLRVDLEESKSAARDFENALRAKETEMAALMAASSTYEARIATLEGSLETERRLLADVRAMLEKAKEAETMAEKKHVDLQAESSKHKAESDALQQSKATLQAELSSLEARLQQSKTSCDTEMKEKERLQRESSFMKATYEQQLESEKRKFAEMEVSMKEKCSNLDGNKSNLEQSLASKTSQAKSLQDSLDAQVSAMAILQSEKNVLGVQKGALETDCAAKQQALEKLEADLQAKNALIEELEEQAREDQKIRRKLHNAVQELKGNIRVFCRVRPFLGGEDAAEAGDSIAFTDRNQGIALTQPEAQKRNAAAEASNWKFKFDHVFGPQSAQEDVFGEISELVQSALDGYRVSIFAYGQTGSGKTHTMLGGNGEQLGMIPRSVEQIFETAEDLAKDKWEFKFKACFVEIYNETVRDLLVKSKEGEKSLTVKFNADTRMSEVVGLTIEDVDSPKKILTLIAKSQKYRATAATAANERSSRSHSVFRLFIEGKNALSGQKLSGLLNLVDLAGSERLNQSKAKGDRLRETQHINKSLSALGDVIASLANKEKHTPFRNSKLTFLLQDSLGGDSKTLMFVNVSPVLSSFNESLCSLRFASKVNACDIGTARKTTKIEF